MQRIHIKIIAILALVSVIFISGLLLFKHYEKRKLKDIYSETIEQYQTSFINLIDITDKTYINLVERLYTLDSGMSDYIREPYEEYENRNLKILIDQYEYDYVIVMDDSANIIYSYSENGKKTDFEYLPIAERSEYLQWSKVYHFHQHMPKAILELRGATVHDNYDTNRVSTIRGYFFIGRYWDKQQLNKLGGITNGRIRAVASDSSNIERKQSDFYNGIIVTSVGLKDWQGQVIGFLINSSFDPKLKKMIYLQGFNLKFYISFATILLLLTFLLIIYWIYRPIKKISDGIADNNIDSLKQISMNRNEFGNLATLLANSLDQRQELIQEINIRKESEEKFKVLISQVPDYIIVHKDAKVAFINEASCTKLGFSYDEIINTSIFNYIAEKDHNRVIENMTRRSLGEHVDDYQISIVGFSGELYEVIVRSSFITYENEPAVLTVLIDITEQKKAEEALKKLLEEHRILLALLPACVYYKDKELKYVSGNQCFIDTVNIRSQEDLRGKTDFNLFDKIIAEKSKKSDEEVLRTGKGQYNIIDKRKDENGKTLYKSTTKVPYFDESGRAIGIIGITWNITEQKETELELIEAKEKAEEASREKQSFLSTMSHEIRTPLNAIIGSSNLLLQDNPRNDQIENLKTLEFSGNLLISLINDILDFSKIEVGKVEFEYVDFNITDFLDRIMKSFHFKIEEKNLTYDVIIDENIPEMLLGDHVRLNQILINLISNAVKFTESGSIKIELSLHDQQNDVFTILFKISDTGIGIPNEKLEDIFEPFKQADNETTRKYGGTGLGLTITKKLVELQGGEINVESIEGKGTTFSFWLGFEKSEQVRTAKYLDIQQNEYFDLSNKNILLVEDNRINQSIAIKFLQMWNAGYELAENGMEALEKIVTKNFDLILMDLQMPEMGGYEASRRIREMSDDYFKSIPIIALTASASLEVRNKVEKQGLNDYVTKPFNPYELNAKINKLINK